MGVFTNALPDTCLINLVKNSARSSGLAYWVSWLVELVAEQGRSTYFFYWCLNLSVKHIQQLHSFDKS